MTQAVAQRRRQGLGGEPSKELCGRCPSSTPAGRSRQPRTNTRKCGNQPAHQSLLTVVLTVLSPALRNRCILPNPFVQRDRTPASNIVDNEHQSSCAITGSRTGCSPPTPTLSTIAARPGTSSSSGPGRSCPSAYATGPVGSDQRKLVLRVGTLDSSHRPGVDDTPGVCPGSGCTSCRMKPGGSRSGRKEKRGTLTYKLSRAPPLSGEGVALLEIGVGMHPA